MTAHSHSVLFYEDDRFFVDAVSSSLLAALARGEAAVIIASDAHIQQLSAHLTANGLPVEHFVAEGRLDFRDSNRLLPRLLVGGWPQESRFKATVGRLIRQKIERFGAVFAFGEMVDVLWQSNRREASIELENLWNRFRADNPFGLECAYRLNPLDVQLDMDRFNDICRVHDTTRSHPDAVQLRRAFLEAVRQVVPTRYVEMLESWIANGGFRDENHVCESVVWLRRYMPELAGRVLGLTRSLLEAPSRPSAPITPALQS